MNNKKYISVEDAIKTTWMILDGLGYAFDENPQLKKTVPAVFDTAPTADVRPVVRGKWVKRRFSENCVGYECLNCHTTWDATTNYCPNCGADMRPTSMTGANGEES